MSDNATEDATPDDKDIARELRANLPATYVDTWSTVTWKGHIRITLGEYMYGKDNYRAAFIMELEDAERLARHLVRAIERRRAREQKSESADASDNG